MEEKTIEQLLELRGNPYYQFSALEQKRVDDFLSNNSEQKNSQKHSGAKSDKNSPAVVKNVVDKATGVLPTADQTAAAENLADGPATHTVHEQ